MGLRDLMHMIFGDGLTVPKNPKLYQETGPSKHSGSKRRRHDKKIRAAQKRARESRKRNQRG